MSNHDGYAKDLFLASLLRWWLFLGILAILAIASGCSPLPNAKDILPSMSTDSGSLSRGETNQTRNQLPQRGCDEKSDSSLTKPLL